MNKSWFTSHDKWFEGIVQFIFKPKSEPVAVDTKSKDSVSHLTPIGNFLPSTNNSLESHNLVIKKEKTFRERMPVTDQIASDKLESVSWLSRHHFCRSDQLLAQYKAGQNDHMA